MKKRQGHTDDHQNHHYMQNNTDQHHRRPHNPNIADLVTHKQKQMQKKDRMNTYSRFQDNDSDDYPNRIYEFEQQEQKKYHRNNQLENQISKQVNDKICETINKLMSKNKITSKTSFDYPILEVQPFFQKINGREIDVPWSKVSAILENGNKIFGFRVDLIGEQVDSFCNMFARENFDKEKQTKPEKQQKLTKLSDLMSSQVKNNLTLHLQKNSESLDINLRTKLMMRKDPLFQRTSRKFDHSTYSSFFMNTISLSKGLYMQINAIQGDSTKGDRQINDGLEMINEENQGRQRDQTDIDNEEFQQAINNLVQARNIGSLAFLNSMENYRENLQIAGVKIYPDSAQWIQQSKKYDKILTMIQKGQLKSAFEYGQTFSYENIKQQIQDDESQIEEDRRFHKVDHRVFYNEEAEARFKKTIVKVQRKEMEEQNEVHVKLEAVNLGGQNNPMFPEGEENIQRSSNRDRPEIPLLQNNENIVNQVIIDEVSPMHVPQIHRAQRKSRKIAEFINIRQPPQKSTTKGSRAKRAPKQRKDASITKLKPKNTLPPQQRQKIQKGMFNTSSKLIPAKVLKKQKPASREIDLDIIVERNLIQPSIACNYQTQHMIQLRPTPTKQQLKIQRKRLRLQLEEEKDRRINNQNLNPNPEQISRMQQQQPTQSIHHPALIDLSSSQQLSQNSPQPITKNQTITAVKQNILTIVKTAKNISFKNLQVEYCRVYGNISPATIFIGMLHLTNQRFIKSVQQNMKDFNISAL